MCGSALSTFLEWTFIIIPCGAMLYSFIIMMLIAMRRSQ